MLTPGFNRWGQMPLHFGTSLRSRIQRDKLGGFDIAGRLKTRLARSPGTELSSQRGPKRKTGAGIAPARRRNNTVKSSTPQSFRSGRVATPGCEKLLECVLHATSVSIIRHNYRAKGAGLGRRTDALRC